MGHETSSLQKELTETQIMFKTSQKELTDRLTEITNLKHDIDHIKAEKKEAEAQVEKEKVKDNIQVR